MRFARVKRLVPLVKQSSAHAARFGPKSSWCKLVGRRTFHEARSSGANARNAAYAFGAIGAAYAWQGGLALTVSCSASSSQSDDSTSLPPKGADDRTGDSEALKTQEPVLKPNAQVSEGQENALERAVTETPPQAEPALESSEAAALNSGTGAAQPVLQETQAVARLAALLPLPAELRGLSPESAAEAERAACAEMTPEQLQARVVELTRYLATARVEAKHRLGAALEKRLDDAEERHLGNLYEALVRTEKSHDEKSAKELEGHGKLLTNQYEQALAQAKEASEANADAYINEQERLQRETWQAQIELERGDRLPEVIAYNAGLANLETVLDNDRSIVERAHAYNNVAHAVLGLEDAILAGRGVKDKLEVLRRAASEADAFMARLVAQLPDTCVERCQNTAAVSPEQKLQTELGNLVAAAFVPPGSGLCGELIGKLFRKLYVLDSEAVPLRAASSRASAVHGNVDAISKVATPLRDMELRTALETLEGSLDGLCRDRATDCLATARAALELRQTLCAVKARVLCLNASLF